MREEPQTRGLIHEVRSDWLWLLLLAVLSAVPFRDGFLQGQIVGAGPDVISTLWGMWWLQQEGVGAIFGTETTLVNFPYGATGIVLSPTSALMWGVLEPICGVGLALALTNWFQITGIAWGMVWLARVCDIPRPWHGVAGLSVLCARYLFFSTGEASIVAIVAMALPLGLACWMSAIKDRGWGYHIGVIVCTIWLAIENPYLATILPLAEVVAFLWHKEKRSWWFWTGIISGMGILTVAHAYGAAANPNYPREVAGQYVLLMNKKWSIVDLPWARLKLSELIHPMNVAWTTSTHNAISAKGGRYLGVIPLICALVALKDRRYRWWVIVGLSCVALAMGSEQNDFALPFLFFNDLMKKVARPLTQPTRLLVMSLVAFGVCVSWTVSQLAQREKGRLLAWGLSGLILVEGILFGGLGLRPPTTVLPSVECDIPSDGGVLIWPEDRKDGELGLSRLLQMSHLHPTPQMGIASWKQADKTAMHALRGAGFSLGSNGWNEQKLHTLGFTHVLVTEREDLSFVVPERYQPCGDYELVELQP